MNGKFFAVFLMGLFWPVLVLTGQTGYSFINPESGKFVLPFVLSQNLIVLPAGINNTDDLQMVLDSGIHSTIISALDDQDTIEMRAARKINIGGLGGGTALEAYFSQGNQLTIGLPGDTLRGVRGSNADVYLLTADHFELARQLGVPVNGLIGSDWFENFIIGVDHVRKVITFYDRKKFLFKKKTRSFSKIPIEIVDGKAFMKIKMVQDNHSVITVRLLIDTGASLSFWIAPIADSAILIPPKTVRSMLGQGLNGTISGVNGRVKTAELGPFVFKNPLVSYPDSASISGIKLNSQRHGSIGNDILRRFTVIYDFQGSAVYLKPNRWFNSPFSYNRSGMDVEKINPKVPIYTIFSVIPGSPAHLAGLKPGDLIEYINNTPALGMSLDDINSVLYGDSGNVVTIRADRNGEKLRIRFHLDEKI